MRILYIYPRFTGALRDDPTPSVVICRFVSLFLLKKFVTLHGCLGANPHASMRLGHSIPPPMMRLYNRHTLNFG